MENKVIATVFVLFALCGVASMVHHWDNVGHRAFSMFAIVACLGLAKLVHLVRD